jgi:hypothetical protein
MGPLTVGRWFTVLCSLTSTTARSSPAFEKCCRADQGVALDRDRLQHRRESRHPPNLRPRQDRRRVADAVHEYVRIVDTRPLPLARIFEAWDIVEALAFYLSSQQCDNVNAATARLRSWCADNDRLPIGMPDLKPDPRMDDTHWFR